MTRIAAYTHLHRLQNPTGVGKHILRMVEGLKGADGVDLSLLVSRPQMADCPPEEYFGKVRTDSFPLSFKWMQKLWVATNWPPAEKFCGDIDWVYCPAESYVPRRKAKLAITVHDLNPFENNLPWSNTVSHQKLRLKWQVLFSKIIKEADLILTVSEFTKSRLIELSHVPEKSIAVVGNGVEDLFFTPPTPLGYPGTEVGNYAVVIGGLSYRKGGDIIVEVAKKLASASPNFKVVVVGKNEPELVSAARNCPNIILTGYANDILVHQILGHSTCLLFPSRYEGFGIPAVEAMAAGTPVIISNQEALREVVGQSGIITESENEMVETILEFQKNSGVRAEYVNRGRERAESFRWNNCVTRLKTAISQ